MQGERRTYFSFFIELLRLATSMLLLYVPAFCKGFQKWFLYNLPRFWGYRRISSHFHYFKVYITVINVSASQLFNIEDHCRVLQCYSICIVKQPWKSFFCSIQLKMLNYMVNLAGICIILKWDFTINNKRCFVPLPIAWI